MYQVVHLYGDYEPWWFFEGWQDQVTEQVTFTTLAEAQSYYQRCYQQLTESYPHQAQKDPYLAAFWTTQEQRWCEECQDDLQQYHGLALLKDGQALTS